jgi:hypothetical protein
MSRRTVAADLIRFLWRIMPEALDLWQDWRDQDDSAGQAA